MFLFYYSSVIVMLYNFKNKFEYWIVILKSIFRIFYSDNSYYEGGLKQNKKHGKGEYHLENGTKIVAVYDNGDYHGNCTIYNSDGTIEKYQYNHGKRTSY